MLTVAALRALLRLSAALVIAAFVFAIPTGSRAQDVPRLDNAITDETGLLEPDRPAIEDALEGLFRDTGVQLYVLFVETTGGVDISDYARLVGTQSLGESDALLVVAVDDRTDNLSVGRDLAGRVSQTSLDRIRAQILEPALGRSDYAGGVIGSAEALGESLAGAGPVAPPSPTTPGGSTANFGSIVLAVVGVLLIALGVLWLLGRVRSLREERQRAFEEAKTQEQLGREANKLLIATDDALRDAEQELGFAEAQFGSAAATALRQALDGAKAELTAAFAIGQELDDSVPEPPEKRRQMIQEIIDRCARAQAIARAQAAELARLRDMERNAPQLIAGLGEKASALDHRLANATDTEARLSMYAASNSASVAGNLDAARDKQKSAVQAIDRAGALLKSGKTSEAVGTATSAEAHLHEATALLDAVDNMARTLDATAEKLDAELVAARQDVAAARKHVEDGSAQSSDMLREAETALADAEKAAGETPPDVMNAFRRATDANALADKVLADARAEQLRQERLHQTAASSIAGAEASVTRARDYIDAHRRSQNIGRMARNRLAEAQQELEQSRPLLETDAERALQLAQSADALADEAYALAQQSAPGYDPVDVGRYRPDTDLGSLIIGAILGGMMSGGSRGGGWTPNSPSSPRRPRGGGWSGGTGGWGGRSSSGGFGGLGRIGSGGFGSGGFGSGGFGGGQSSGGFGGGRASSGRW